MFDMHQLPFPMALNNKELLENIRGFEEEKYEKRLGEFMEEMGIFEDGKASERVVGVIKH